MDCIAFREKSGKEKWTQKDCLQIWEEQVQEQDCSHAISTEWLGVAHFCWLRLSDTWQAHIAGLVNIVCKEFNELKSYRL